MFTFTTTRNLKESALHVTPVVKLDVGVKGHTTAKSFQKSTAVLSAMKVGVTDQNPGNVVIFLVQVDVLDPRRVIAWYVACKTNKTFNFTVRIFFVMSKLVILLVKHINFVVIYLYYKPLKL